MTGAALSGVGVVEQLKYATDIDGEIDVRKEVQDLAAQTNDIVDENAAALNTTSASIEGAQAGVDASGGTSEGETTPSITPQENPIDDPKKEEDEV